MPIATEKQTELFDDLVTIANGDVNLVEKALWIASEQGARSAKLEDVIAYIKKHRTDQTKQVA